MEKIGLVTVLYKSDELLEDFFKSIATQDYKNCEIYLIDNTPSPATREVIKKMQEKFELNNITHIECSKNVGAAAGNNIGIELALNSYCDYVILSNNDIYFNNTRLFSSLLSLAKSKALPIIAPKIYYADSNKLWFAGGGVIKWQAAVTHYGNTEEDKGQYNSSCFTGYAPTTFVFMEAGVFKAVKEMDTSYFIYSEDLDFMHRASNKGYKIWYEASLSLFHKVSSTTGGVFSDAGFYYTTRNRIYFARKFYSFLQSSIAITYVSLSLLRHAILQKRASAVQSFFRGLRHGIIMKVSKKI
ncbi:MAG TPA: glycosyltransferase family 2 protein [Chitinophagaceae bacterium]|nr:glycosyltransferase family 2 protein [Chitinophagaceae bacterium]